MSLGTGGSHGRKEGGREGGKGCLAVRVFERVGNNFCKITSGPNKRHKKMVVYRTAYFNEKLYFYLFFYY